MKKKVQEILDTQASAVIALVKLAEERDGDTGKHLERVRLYCYNLAEALRRVPHYAEKIDDFFIENISLASTLHDIGKLGIKDQILTKPDRLSPEEYEEVKKHTLIGSRTLQSIREVYPNKAFSNWCSPDVLGYGEKEQSVSGRFLPIKSNGIKKHLLHEKVFFELPFSKVAVFDGDEKLKNSSENSRVFLIPARVFSVSSYAGNASPFAGGIFSKAPFTMS